MQHSDFGRLVGVLVAPSETFASIARRPSWVVALIVLVLLSFASAMVSVPRIDWEEATRLQLEQSNPEMTAEEIEQTAAMGAKLGPITSFTAPVIVAISYFLLALVCWISFRLIGAELTYRMSLATSIHATIPSGVVSLLGLAVMLPQETLDLERLQSGAYVKSSLAAFLGDGIGPVANTLLGSIDFFSIWTVVLLAIGFSTTGKVARGRATIAALSLWALWIAFKVGLAAIGQAFT